MYVFSYGVISEVAGGDCGRWVEGKTLFDMIIIRYHEIDSISILFIHIIKSVLCFSPW